MPGIQKHAVDRQVGVTWAAVSGVQQVVYVARIDDRPIAILELRPTFGFRLTACSGEHIGDFRDVDDGKATFDRWLRDRA